MHTLHTHTLARAHTHTLSSSPSSYKHTTLPDYTASAKTEQAIGCTRYSLWNMPSLFYWSTIIIAIERIDVFRLFSEPFDSCLFRLQCDEVKKKKLSCLCPYRIQAWGVDFLVLYAVVQISFLFCCPMTLLGIMTVECLGFCGWTQVGETSLI